MERFGTDLEQDWNVSGTDLEQLGNVSGTDLDCSGNVDMGQVDDLKGMSESSEMMTTEGFKQISRRAFQERYGVNNHQFADIKAHVEGADTSKGLSPVLHKAFKIWGEKLGIIQTLEKEPESQLESLEPPAIPETKVIEPNGVPIVVRVGRSESALTLAVPTVFSLSELRTSDLAQTIEDPLAIAEQALAVMDSVSSAMKQDLEDQKTKLRNTQAAVNQMETRASKLQLEKLQYQMEDRITSELQNPATAKLQELLGVVGNVHPPASSGSNGSVGSSQQ